MVRGMENQKIILNDNLIIIFKHADVRFNKLIKEVHNKERHFEIPSIYGRKNLE